MLDLLHSIFERASQLVIIVLPPPIINSFSLLLPIRESAKKARTSLLIEVFTTIILSIYIPRYLGLNWISAAGVKSHQGILGRVFIYALKNEYSSAKYSSAKYSSAKYLLSICQKRFCNNSSHFHTILE